MNLPAFASHLGWTLLHFVWQGALLGCATALALTLLRNAHPRLRYLVAGVGLLLCLVWPLHDLLARLLEGSDAQAAALPAALGAFADGVSAPGLRDWLQAHLSLLVQGWSLCAAALALRMALGLVWIGRSVQQAHTDPAWQARLTRMAAQCGIERAVRLRVVAHLSSPITAGWWRPVVLVPASLLAGMPPQLLDALLAHELAHIRRYDYLVNLAQHVAETVLFYHPAVWWLSHRMRVERELIADDLAASQLGDRRRLALALSALAQCQCPTHDLAQAANGGKLLMRIKHLLQPEAQALRWKAAIPALGLALLAACGTPATAPLAEQAPPEVQGRLLFASCAKPVYPAAALAAAQEGTVSMSFQVGTDGKVRTARLDQSSGHAALDDAAMSALGKCSFTPATTAGQPVVAWVPVKYVWTRG